MPILINMINLVIWFSQMNQNLKYLRIIRELLFNMVKKEKELEKLIQIIQLWYGVQ